MHTISLGPDTTELDIPETVDWVVYWYEVGSYCGSGEAVYLDENRIYYGDLGHCSCYGPERATYSSMTQDEALTLVEYDPNLPKRKRDPDDYRHHEGVALWSKVSELILHGGVLVTTCCHTGLGDEE